jgi:hypothetical protein
MEIASKALLRGIFDEASFSELRTSEPSFLPAFFTELQTDEMALNLRSRKRLNRRVGLEIELSTVAHISYGRVLRSACSSLIFLLRTWRFWCLQGIGVIQAMVRQEKQ